MNEMYETADKAIARTMDMALRLAKEEQADGILIMELTLAEAISLAGTLVAGLSIAYVQALKSGETGFNVRVAAGALDALCNAFSTDVDSGSSG